MPASDQFLARRSGATGTATRTDRGWEVAVDAPSLTVEPEWGVPLLGKLVDEVARHGGGPVRWRVPAPTANHRQIAEAHGFNSDRSLFQLRRELPLPWTTDLPTRAFDSDVDIESWIAVNNAAFSWHPEQSAWTPADLAAVMAEPWFDPEGFLVHPVSGPMKGFCWTKVHDELDPPMGEIFVIGVDPAHHGQGLGKALVLAGLDHLAGRGLRQAMLYTEADNLPALRLYQGLGFEIDHEIVVFEQRVAPAQTLPTTEPMP